MAPLPIHNDTFGAYVYTIYFDEGDENYFLTINEEPYREHEQTFKGSFTVVCAKLEEVKLALGPGGDNA
jgi:hypothetical protein